MTIRHDQPLLTRTEQHALFAQSRAGDAAAFKALVESHLPLVTRIARSFPDLIPFEDRYQEGARGLIAAVQGFDPDQGNMFASYAIPAIARFIRKAIREELGASEVDGEKWVRMTLAVDRLRAELCRNLEPVEAAAAANLATEEVERLSNLFGDGNLLLNHAVEEPPEVEDLPAPAEERPDHAVGKTDEETFMKASFRKLPDPERRALSLFFRLDGEPQRTLEEIAVQLGCKEWEVGHLKTRGLIRLRRLMKVNPNNPQK